MQDSVEWSGSSRDGLMRYARAGLWALPVWSALLLIGTWTHQPDPGTNFAEYADYITTTWFLISHLVASIFGAAVGIIGLTALFVILAVGGTLRLATIALMTSITGNVLVTAVFGAAAFAQPAIGNAYKNGLTSEAVTFDSDVYGPALFATALPGLLLFTLGLVLFGVAVARTSFLPRFAGYLLIVSGILFAVVGFLIGPVQTVGAALLIVSTLWIVQASRTRKPAQIEAPRPESRAQVIH